MMKPTGDDWRRACIGSGLYALTIPGQDAWEHSWQPAWVLVWLATAMFLARLIVP